MNNIYSLYPEFIEAAGFQNPVSVYIPSIHREYDVTTIAIVFQRLFGTVYRVDSVYNEDKPNFKSVFVYYYENNYFNEARIPIAGNMVFPGHFVQNRQIFSKTPVKPTEYWLIFENKTMFPDTTLTLDEISKRLDIMEAYLKNDKEEQELDILAENGGYLRELRYAQNTHGSRFLDTTINIHQLAQNLKLMEDRYVAKQELKFKFDFGTTVFVEGIPTEFKELQMWEHFVSRPGFIGVKVCRLQQSNGFGFVCFDSVEEAEAMIKETTTGFKMAIVV
jgi:hypothetical protein